MVYAMFAMVLLTFAVGLVTVITRVSVINKKQVSIKAFALMDYQKMPDKVTQTTRNFNHLFEVPLLFYVAASLCVYLSIDNYLTLALAWLFVASRYLHSFIHLTYNNILHRLSIFWLGFICVLGLWIVLVVNLA